MSQTQTQPGVPQVQPSLPFKKQYKREGMIVSVILMWLDYAYVYNGLVSNDATMMSSGMVVMLIAAAIAYYFG